MKACKSAAILARELIDLHELDIAIAILEPFLVKYPNEPELNYLYAFCLHARNRSPERAAHHYDLAGKLGFDPFYVSYNRGQLYLSMGKKERAIEDLNEALFLYPEHRDLQRLLSDIGVINDDSVTYSSSVPRLRLLANSIPKAGTHLLDSCLNGFPGLRFSGFHIEHEEPHQVESILAETRNGLYVSSHLYPSETNIKILHEHGYKSILIIRDPRDIVVSWVHYATDKLYVRYTDYLQGLPTTEDRLMAGIIGVDRDHCSKRNGQEDIGTVVREYLKWRQVEGNLIVRYENLIGEKGGGSLQQQQAEISKMAIHLGIDLDDVQVNEIASACFDANSPTFRKGEIGDWKNFFNDEHKDKFKKLAGDLLVDMGYEHDHNW